MYCRVTLHDAIVTAVRNSGTAAEGATEEASFSYGRIEWEYTPRSSSDGKAQPVVRSGWDVVGNKKLEAGAAAPR